MHSCEWVNSSLGSGQCNGQCSSRCSGQCNSQRSGRCNSRCNSRCSSQCSSQCSGQGSSQCSSPWQQSVAVFSSSGSLQLSMQQAVAKGQEKQRSWYALVPALCNGVTRHEFSNHEGFFHGARPDSSVFPTSHKPTPPPSENKRSNPAENTAMPRPTTTTSTPSQSIDSHGHCTASWRVVPIATATVQQPLHQHGTSGKLIPTMLPRMQSDLST